MKVGSIVLATEQGLGYLAKDFYDNGVVTDVIIINHTTRKNHREWYPSTSVVLPPNSLKSYWVSEFVKRMDVMLFFETPWDWKLLQVCEDMGTPSIIMPMYECHPRAVVPPSLYLCPSVLDFDIFKAYGPALQCTVPVNPASWKWRRKARVFVHNAGNGGLRGRNGTQQLIEAMPLIRVPIQIILRAQEGTWTINNADKTVMGVPRETLYEEGDVFLFPDKFQGLSLPLQEARAAGMLVMSTDRYPANTWLPREPLIPVTGYQRASVSPSYMEFDEAIVSPKDIADTIEKWYNKDISDYSISGRRWAEENSWATHLNWYLYALEQLANGNPLRSKPQSTDQRG
jgi:hypothetical protein